ncbi:cag pathogenicity island protein [Helicobacter pylori]
MGRDEILQQTPLKTPLDRTKCACQTIKFYAPMTTQSIKLIFIG